MKNYMVYKMNSLIKELEERWLLKQLQHKYEQFGDELLANRLEIHFLIQEIKGLKNENC